MNRFPWTVREDSCDLQTTPRERLSLTVEAYYNSLKKLKTSVNSDSLLAVGGGQKQRIYQNLHRRCQGMNTKLDFTPHLKVGLELLRQALDLI